MERHSIRRYAMVVPLALVTLLVAACSADPEAGQSTGSPPVTPTATTEPTTGTSPPGTSAPAGVTEIVVTETEYTIALANTNLAPGTYTFVVKNDGGDRHDLVINGPGVNEARTEELPGGQQSNLTVTLQPGSYELWCSVENHRELGMSVNITVG